MEVLGVTLMESFSVLRNTMLHRSTFVCRYNHFGGVYCIHPGALLGWGEWRDRPGQQSSGDAKWAEKLGTRNSSWNYPEDEGISLLVNYRKYLRSNPSPGFDPRTAQPLASRYTGWAIAAHPLKVLDDNLIFFWPCIMNWLYINYQLLCTDYYLFIKY